MVPQHLLNTARYIKSIGFSFNFDYSCLFCCLATAVQRNCVPIFTTMIGMPAVAISVNVNVLHAGDERGLRWSQLSPALLAIGGWLVGVIPSFFDPRGVTYQAMVKCIKAPVRVVLRA